MDELVGFLHDPNPQVRQIALENVIGYTTASKDIFLANDCAAAKDILRLVHQPSTVTTALVALVNLSQDEGIRNLLCTAQCTRLLCSLAKSHEAACMLLANLTKSPLAIAHLLDDEASLTDLLENYMHDNDDTNYLSYVFADLATHPKGQQYIFRVGDPPIQRIAVFTQHKAKIRRAGAASVLKNSAFDAAMHETLLALLSYILLPLCGPEEFSLEEMDGMPEDLQLLPPTKRREDDLSILLNLVETLILLEGTQKGRETMREAKVYPVIRQLHAGMEDDAVRDACERFVQIIMLREQDEEPEVKDDEIVEIV